MGYYLKAAQQFNMGKLQMWQDQVLTRFDYQHSRVRHTFAFCLNCNEFRMCVDNYLHILSLATYPSGSSNRCRLGRIDHTGLPRSIQL